MVYVKVKKGILITQIKKTTVSIVKTLAEPVEQKILFLFFNDVQKLFFLVL